MWIHYGIFKAYDIRGIFGREVNSESVTIITRACLNIFGSGKIIVGYDGRHGSKDLAEKICETIKASDNESEVVLIGLCTSPMFYFYVNDEMATGGMMVTASHNPKEYSGIKIVGPEARTISGFDVEKVVRTLNNTS